MFMQILGPALGPLPSSTGDRSYGTWEPGAGGWRRHRSDETNRRALREPGALSRCPTCIRPLTPHGNPARQVASLSPFYKGETEAQKCEVTPPGSHCRIRPGGPAQPMPDPDRKCRGGSGFAPLHRCCPSAQGRTFWNR